MGWKRHRIRVSALEKKILLLLLPGLELTTFQSQVQHTTNTLSKLKSNN